MDFEDQNETLIEASQKLMRKYSVDPYIGKFRPEEETLKEELDDENVEDFDDRLLSAWPGDWPGRKTVDLDDFGDPSAFLKDNMGEGICYHILGSSKNDSFIAEHLAQLYLEEILYQGLPRCRDFVDKEEEKEEADEKEMEDFINDFKGFIKTWRERVISTIERQSFKKGR